LSDQRVQRVDPRSTHSEIDVEHRVVKIGVIQITHGGRERTRVFRVELVEDLVSVRSFGVQLVVVDSIVITEYLSLNDLSVGLDPVTLDRVVRIHPRGHGRRLRREEEDIVEPRVIDQAIWNERKVNLFHGLSETCHPELSREVARLVGDRVAGLTHVLMNHVRDSSLLARHREQHLGFVSGEVHRFKNNFKLIVPVGSDNGSRSLVDQVSKSFRFMGKPGLLGEGEQRKTLALVFLEGLVKRDKILSSVLEIEGSLSQGEVSPDQFVDGVSAFGLVALSKFKVEVMRLSFVTQVRPEIGSEVLGQGETEMVDQVGGSGGNDGVGWNSNVENHGLDQVSLFGKVIRSLDSEPGRGQRL